jgi:hypothetical protein
MQTQPHNPSPIDEIRRSRLVLSWVLVAGIRLLQLNIGIGLLAFLLTRMCGEAVSQAVSRLDLGLVIFVINLVAITVIFWDLICQAFREALVSATKDSKR